MNDSTQLCECCAEHGIQFAPAVVATDAQLIIICDCCAQNNVTEDFDSAAMLTEVYPEAQRSTAWPGNAPAFINGGRTELWVLRVDQLPDPHQCPTWALKKRALRLVRQTAGMNLGCPVTAR